MELGLGFWVRQVGKVVVRFLGGACKVRVVGVEGWGVLIGFEGWAKNVLGF